MKMMILWPAGFCFLALQVCNHCEVDVDKQSGLIPLFNGTDVNVPVATVSGTYDECGAVDVTKGLYVKIDDPTFLSYIKSVSEKVALIPDDKSSQCPAIDGQKCSFPFNSGGVRYETCTEERTCATRFDEQGDAMEMVGCSEQCPFKSGGTTDVDTEFEGPKDNAKVGADSSSTEASNVELVNPIDQLDVEPETEATFVVETPVSLVVDLGTGVKPVSAVQKSAMCVYTCRSRGSCTVRIQTFGGPTNVDGNVQGFCFSPTFGGRCNGIPKGCDSCANVCKDRAGQQFSVEENIAKGPEAKIKIVPLVAGEKDQCLYSCKENRGCSVQIVSIKLRSGSTKGSCFPPSFGGACSGIPKGCNNCLDVCGQRSGEEFLLPVPDVADFSGISVEYTPQADLSGISVTTLTAPKRTDSCVYTCHKNGGCSVDFIGDSFITGNVRGSCFPPAFGGKCNGIPDGCHQCLDICKLQPDGRFVVPNGADAKVVSLSNGVDKEPETVICKYKCQPIGSCSVQSVSSKGHVKGKSLGSCFSKAFGGTCSGTPAGCDDCLTACEQRNESEFQIPAKKI